MSKPSVDLPTPGRAARTTMFPAWKPFVRASRSLNPVMTPSLVTPDEIASISSSAAGRSSLS